jgi:hypothetical protein
MAECCRTPTSKADWLDPSWLSPSAGIDVVRDLGCELGPDPSVNNAEIISDALDDFDHTARFLLPAGDLYITEAIVWPYRAGTMMEGQGMGAAYGNSMYQQSGLAGQTSRIIWAGGAGDDTQTGLATMLRYHGLNCTIANIQFQGREITGAGPEPADDTAVKARVGVHVVSNADDQHTGKLTLRNVQFHQIHNHILCGKDLVPANASGTITGGDEDHADDLVLDNVVFMHGYVARRYSTGTVTVVSGVVTLASGTFPAWAATNAHIEFDTDNTNGIRGSAYYKVASRQSGSQVTMSDTSVSIAAGRPYRICQEATSVRVRNDQSVEHNAVKIGHWGYGNEVFWFERGGRFHATSVGMFGGHCTLLRIGHAQINYCRYQIDSFDIDRNDAELFELLHVDHEQFAPTYVEMGGIICGSDDTITGPIITARGTMQVVLRGVTGGRGIDAENILLLGAATRYCKCRLEDCIVESDTPAALLHNDCSASYTLKWNNVSRRFDGANWGDPITDGASP